MTQYLYLKIARRLQQQIEEGQYKPHQKLPSEQTLAKQFETSRLTVRRAIDWLAQQKIVMRDRNRGTYVLVIKPKISSGASGLVGFSEAAKQRHLKPETKVLEMVQTTAYPRALAKAMQLEKDEAVWRIKRLRSVENEPFTHEEIYLKSGIIADLTLQTARNSLYAAIEKQLSIGYATQEIEAVLLNDHMAKLLKTAADQPAFLVHSLTYSVDGYPILYENSYYRSDKYTFHNSLYRQQS